MSERKFENVAVILQRISISNNDRLLTCLHRSKDRLHRPSWSNCLHPSSRISVYTCI